MSEGNHSLGQSSVDAGQRWKASKWRYIYFLLAAFDLVTVCAGLYLNHQIMGIYTRSVEVNRVWAERVNAYSSLGALAADVDAPGNDVFDSRNVADEFVRMRVAEKAFDLSLEAQRKELLTNLDPEVAAPLLAHLDAIAFAKTEMTKEAVRIFDYFRAGRPGLAGERMATMDKKYAKLNTALLELRRSVSVIQERNFEEQTAAAAVLQRFEYLIGLSIVLMVLGATLYGHKIARQMQWDTEEKERHFNALRKAEARTHSILDSTAEGIITFDQQGRIESFNQAAERLFGHAAGEAIGGYIQPMIPVMAASLESTLGQNEIDSNTRIDCILGGSCIGDPLVCKPLGPKHAGPCVFSGDGVGLHRDGTSFPLELSVTRVDLGTTTIFTAIVRDIADRRKVEEALRTVAAAQAANRAKSQFLANMSHEIRTPMNGVLGMAEMLLDTRLTATQRRFAEGVRRSGEALLKIIDGILDFSKIEAGKVELECLDFKPRELTAEVMQLLRESAEKKGLALVCHVAEDVSDTLRGAAAQLRQVLINLVGNAIKFTDRGSVTLTLSRLDAPIAANRGDAAFSAAQQLHFSVADTGIGIDPKVQERLFRAFEQADSSTTRRYGGTGLGLAISKELVEKMGGRIGVRSSLGEGAEFWFTMTLEPALAPRFLLDPGAEILPATSTLSGVRVLLAEDNPINQDVALTMLKSFGCQVRVVDNGAKALAALGNSSFDIVLMDCQMPEMDGFDATAEIRARQLPRPRQAPGAAEPARLPIVGLTASALKDDREICIAAGMDDYLAKPFRREELRLVLERWTLDRGGENVSLANDGMAADCTFDRAALDQIGMSQRAGAKVVGALIDGYLADAKRLIEALERASGQADGGALAHAAHLLGMSSDFMGARKLAQLCGELERAGLAGETQGIGQRVACIQQEYEAVRLALGAMRSGGEKTSV